MIRLITKLFRKKKEPETVTRVVFERVQLRNPMTLAQWRSSTNLCRAAQELWQNPTFQDILSVLRSSRPSGYPLIGQPVTETQAAIQLGRLEGYDLLLAVLCSLPEEQPKAAEEIEADYGADKILEQQLLTPDENA